MFSVDECCGWFSSPRNSQDAPNTGHPEKCDICVVNEDLIILRLNSDFNSGTEKANSATNIRSDGCLFNSAELYRICRIYI